MAQFARSLPHLPPHEGFKDHFEAAAIGTARARATVPLVPIAAIDCWQGHSRHDRSRVDQEG